MILNAAHAHLMLNHYPIFAVFFGTLLFAFGLRFDQQALRLASYAFLISAGAVVIAVYVTGSLAEDEIEHLAGVMTQAIDSHEDAGKVTLLFVLLASIAAAYAGWCDRRGKLVRSVQIALLALGVAGFVAGGYTALLGGYIHHQEIRPGFQTGVVDR